MDKYGEEGLYGGNVLNKLDIDGDVKYLHVIKSVNTENGQKVLTNKVFVKSLNNNGVLSDSNVIEWIDIKLVGEKGDNFTRYRGNNGFVYKNGKLDYCEGYYNFGNFIEGNKEQEFNDKFGSFDLETMAIEDSKIKANGARGREEFNIPIKESDLLGLGEHIVYAGGWRTKDYSDYKYVDESCNKDNIIINLIDSIFAKELYKYTFFVHNLGKFDGLYLIHDIMIGNGKYELKGKWKTEEIKLIGLTVIEKKSRKRIYFKDSMNFFQANLKKILEVYGCDTQKGCFPHSFMNSSNLNYIGNKPDFKYYDGLISKNDYMNIPSYNWNCKIELMKYLHSDVEGLFEVINLFAKTIYSKFSVNVNSFYTLPSLALNIYLNDFHNKGLEIKMIRGQVEKDIRRAYHGGIVNVYNKNLIKNAYYYDMNSQYPFAMLQDMPVGNPIFTTNTNLDDTFGFVFGTIIPLALGRLLNQN
jgi:DNA polymerase type B, organellar and viral